MSEAIEQVNESSENNLPPSQTRVCGRGRILDSLKIDTGHTLRPQPVLRSTSQHCIDQPPLPDQAEKDADAHQDDDEHLDKDPVAEATSTQPEQLLTVFLPTNDITLPTEKVGCILVTSHLQQFLEDYPPSSDKHAFLDVCQMLSLLDKYLYDKPKQHTHCMSSDNEYVTLLKYAICLNIDSSMFPTLWAVLCILLDTQDGNLEHVKLLQEEYNTYYADKSRKYMVNIETKSVEIQNQMHDSVTQDFDRVSDLNDNGLTPLQGQQDEQPEAVNRPDNAIDNDVVDIMTLHPPWSPDTNDRCDSNQVASDRNRQEIQDELYKDTPVKTENNKPYIDNIDANNRDRALITKPLSDRLGLGQNNLPGAQQVRVAVKHTDQMTETPEHLRQISLGEEMEITSYEEIDRNRNFIPWVDSTKDSRDSLDQTLDSIDLTESQVKHTNTQRQMEKINEDTSDDDTDEMIDFDNDKLKKTDRKETNE